MPPLTIDNSLSLAAALQDLQPFSDAQAQTKADKATGTPSNTTQVVNFDDPKLAEFGKDIDGVKAGRTGSRGETVSEKGIVATGAEESVEVVEGWSIIASEVDEKGNAGAMFLDDGKLNGKNLLKEFPKAPPKSVDANFDSPEGARDVLLETCKNIKERYVGKADIEAQIQACRDEVAKMPEGPQKEMMQGRLAQLENQAKETIATREKVVRFIPTEKRTVQNLNASQKDRDKIALRDIKDANVAIRNLNYDLKRTHGQYGVLGKGFNYLKQSFTTTRNGLARWFQNKGVAIKAKLSVITNKLSKKTGANEMDLLGRIKDQNQKITSAEIKAADASYDAFTSMVSGFMKSVGQQKSQLAKPTTFEGGKAPTVDRPTQTALDDIKTVSEALQTKAGGTPEFTYGLEQSLLSTFKSMSKGNSYREFGLKITAGVAIPVPITDVKVQAEYKYTFRVYGSPTGKVRIERCHAGGVHGEAGFKFGEIGQAHGGGEVTGGKGHEDGFVSPEDAAKELSSGKLGPLHLFFSSNTKTSAVMSILKSVPSAKPKAPKFDEGVFLNQARERGLLDKTDSISFKKTTVGLSTERDFKRVTGQVAGAGSVGIEGVVSAKAGLDLNVEGDVGAKRTEFKSYYTYFTTDRIGEAKKTYLAIKDDANPNPLENQSSVTALLNRQPATEAEKTELANDILNELKTMIDREASYTESIKGTEKSMRPSAETVCSHYRQATIALVALLDHLNANGGAPDADFQKHLDDAVETLRDNLQRPGLDMTKKQLADGLYVQRSYGDNKVVLRGRFRAEADFATVLQDNLNGLTDSKGGRIAIAVATQGIGKAISLNPGIEFDVTCEIPKGDDKRPYRQHNKTTLDLRFGTKKTDLTGKAIVALVQDAYRKAAKQPEAKLKEQQLDAVSIVKALGVSTLTSIISVVKPSGGEDEEMSEEAAEEALCELVSNSASGKNTTLSFQFEDGRLSAVGIGNGRYTLSSTDQTVGMLAIGGDVERQANIINETIYASPSFDSLMSIGDEFRSLGHGSDWARFSVKNEHAFMRMAQIVAGQDIPGDKNVADDRKRLEEMLDRMQRDIHSCPRQEQRERLQENMQRFLSAQAKLAGYYSLPKKEQAMAKQDILAAMRTVLETASDHYNILESVGGHGGALAMDETKNLRESEVDGFTSFDWKR